MTPTPCRATLAAALFAFAGAAFAQTPDNAARPADGAIKGGSILPGENAGVPTDKASEKAINRCQDLTGTLREQCVAQERGASTGGTRAPEIDVAKPPPAREAPPPQNPPRAR